MFSNELGEIFLGGRVLILLRKSRSLILKFSRKFLTIFLS